MGEAAQRRASSQPDNKRVLAEEANAILIDGEGLEDYFFDGVGQLNIGVAVTKIKFFKVANLETKNNAPYETREIAHVVVMPTPAFYAWVTNFANSLASNMPQLEKAAQANVEAMRNFVKTFNVKK
jgi:ABC-type Zn uptake system ZnuABC Zn-binding protein ZnuA